MVITKSSSQGTVIGRPEPSPEKKQLRSGHVSLLSPEVWPMTGSPCSQHPDLVQKASTILGDTKEGGDKNESAQ